MTSALGRRAIGYARCVSGTRTALALALAGCDAVFGTSFEVPLDAYQHDADTTGCLRDTFHDDVIDPQKWRVDMEGVLVIRETGGQLVIAIQEAALGHAALSSVKRYDVTGGQAVVAVGVPTVNTAEALLSLELDPTHAYSIRGNATTITFQTVAPTAGQPVQLPYDAATMHYWRIVYLMVGPDAVMNFDTSGDNISWVNRHSETTAHVPVTSLEVQLGARSTSGGVSAQATFDDFQLVTTGCPLI